MVLGPDANDLESNAEVLGIGHLRQDLVCDTAAVETAHAALIEIAQQ